MLLKLMNLFYHTWTVISQNKKMNKQHFDWIDYVKGVAILLVVLGHSFPDASAVGGGKSCGVENTP